MHKYAYACAGNKPGQPPSRRAGLAGDYSWFRGQDMFWGLRFYVFRHNGITKRFVLKSCYKPGLKKRYN